MSLLSEPGSILIQTMLTKSLAEGLWYTQTEFLSKEVLVIVTARQRNAQMIKVLGAYILL